MEPEVVESEMVLPNHMRFKKIQMYEKYPKGQARVRWKHLKQIIPAENYQNYSPDEPNCESFLSNCEITLCVQIISTIKLSLILEVQDYRSRLSKS